MVLNPSLIAGPLTFKYDFYGPPNFLYERILEILKGILTFVTFMDPSQVPLVDPRLRTYAIDEILSQRGRICHVFLAVS